MQHVQRAYGNAHYLTKKMRRRVIRPLDGKMVPIPVASHERLTSPLSPYRTGKLIIYHDSLTNT